MDADERMRMSGCGCGRSAPLSSRCARKLAAWALTNCLQPAVAFTASLANRVAPEVRKLNVKRACAGAVSKFRANPRWDGCELLQVDEIG